MTTLYSIGHSTRPLDELIALLSENGITRLVDVRTLPRSRHNPQFNGDSLSGTLSAVGMSYLHMPALGGLRRARKDSVNMGWKNASFRGYADYMQTPEFEQALTQLIGLAERAVTAIMCAEAVPWRCHRSLIADALTIRGLQVHHIMAPGKWQQHKLTPFARVAGMQITYPFALQG